MQTEAKSPFAPFDPNDPPLRAATSPAEWDLASDVAKHAYVHSIEPAIEQHLNTLHAVNPTVLVRLVCVTVICIRTMAEIHKVMGVYADNFPEIFSEEEAVRVFQAARAELTVAFDVMTSSFFEGVRKEKADG